MPGGTEGTGRAQGHQRDPGGSQGQTGLGSSKRPRAGLEPELASFLKRMYKKTIGSSTGVQNQDSKASGQGLGWSRLDTPKVKHSSTNLRKWRCK